MLADSNHPPRDLNEVARVVAAEWLRDKESDVSWHPDIDDLVAFQEGRLADARRDELTDHLSHCSECAAELASLRAFDDAYAETERSSHPVEPEWVDAAWRELERDTTGDLTSMRTPTEAARIPLSGPPSRNFSAWSWAASMTLAVIALSVLLMPRDGAEKADFLTAARPQFFDLVPDEQHRSRSAAGSEIQVAADVNVLVPRLHLADLASYDSYRVEIRADDGSIVWRDDLLERQPAGQFLLLIASRDLPPGSYVLKLTARSEGADRHLATYSFILRSVAD